MGRGSKIKHIEKNGYSKFQQVLVKSGDKKSKSKNPAKSVTPETSEVLEKCETREKPEIPDKSEISVPEKSGIPGTSGTLEKCKSSKRLATSNTPVKFEKLDKTDKYVKIDQHEKSYKTDRSTECESLMMSEKPDTPNGAVKIDRTEIPVRPDSNLSTSDTSKTTKEPERPDTSVKSETPKKFETSKKPETSMKSEMLKRSKRAETHRVSEKVEKNERSVRPETPDRPETLEKSDKSEISQGNEIKEQQDETSKIAEPEILKESVSPEKAGTTEKTRIPEKSEKNERNESLLKQISAKPIKFEQPGTGNCQILEHSEKVGKIAFTEAIKHPLEYTWCMWLITNDKRNWEDNLVKLTTFDTVEDYWCLYHHMKPPSQLERGKDYAVFKNGFRPMWEDRANRAGGRWIVNFDRKRNEASDLDSVWMFVVLLLIGESFKVPEAICGTVVSIRTKSRVAVWVADYRNVHAVLEVGKTVRDILGLRNRLSFQQHDTSETIYSL